MTAYNISYIYTLKDSFSGKLQKINRLTKKNGLILRSVSKDMKAVSSDYKRFTLVGVAAFTGVAIAAARFQSGLTDVQNLLDKDTISKFSKDLDLAQESAVRLGFTIPDTNKSLFDTISAIGDVNKSLEIFKTAQKLAIGGSTSLAIAVDGQTSVINAYGKEQTSATEVANAFFSAQRAGKTTVAELAENVGKVAPLAKQAGISFKILLASMSQLTVGGLNTEESSTALRGAIAGLLKPSKQARKIFEALNIPVGASALRNADFTDVLEKLAFVAKKTPDALAEMIPNIRALTAVSALGEKEVNNLRLIVKNMNNDIKKGTGLNEAYENKLKDVTQQWKIAIGTFKVVSKNFGKELLPAATKFFKTLTKIMELVIELSPATTRIILIAAGLATAFTGMVAGISAFLALKGTLILTLGIITKGFIVMWAAATGPIGILVAAFIGITVLGVLLYNKWKPFKFLIDAIISRLLTVGKFIGKLGSVGSQLLGSIGLGKGSFDANINLNAPKGSVASVQTKEKKNNVFNLGFNMQEA